MSNLYNELLLDRTNEALDMASRLLEDLTSTTPGKVLDAAAAQVIKHVDDNNLDDLFNYSLPALENKINEYNKFLVEQAREHFYRNDLMGESDVY